MNILVSACLVGTNCKYSGGNNLVPKVEKFGKEHNMVPVCPEELGGLATPREPCEIQGGTGKEVLEGKAIVLNKAGEDVTANFLEGAQKALDVAKQHRCTVAVLKSRSPSCGCGIIHGGSFDGKLINGNGVTAQLLLDNKILVMTELDFE
ncbi:MAG TPA: DUF523 domain-containing protein [Bacillota bacterium]|nr:DUF523 domain-containing protein [Bacillota bacterium]HOR85470.1 DUF523 domain-containing protein [Bacillota bacterium]HPL53609.1 DUF523 domain-containing protein [Bacillota bacterium]